MIPILIAIVYFGFFSILFAVRSKRQKAKDADVGDEQFEINDSRSFESMYQDMEQEGLQPVLNDYLYV